MKSVHWFFGVVALSSLLAGGAVGCGGSDSGSPTGAGGTNGGGGSSGALTCDNHPNAGAQVPETAGAGTMPAPAGGTIVDGTYYLTKWDIYPPGSIDAYLRKETWIVANGTLQSVSQTDNEPEKRNAGTFTTAGTTITLNVTCPQTATLQSPYTATATTVAFLQTSAQGNEVHTYTKQ